MTTPESPREERAPDDEPERMPRTPAHDVFVSYSTNDKPVADAIVARLEQAGIRCWVAPRDVVPGEVWGEAILRAIHSSRLMVVVLSGAANESRQVIREVERAVAGDVVVVPFRIDESEPTGAMAYFLASEHWLDAMTPPMEAHIAQLVTVARALLASRPRRGGAVAAGPSTAVTDGAASVPAAAAVVDPTAPTTQAAAEAPTTEPVAAPSWGIRPGAPGPAPAGSPARPGAAGRAPLIAGALVAAVVLVVGLSWVAGIGPWQAAATPSPAPTATPTPAPTSTPIVTPTPAPTPTPPVGREEDVHLLTQLVPSGVRAGCAAAPLAGRELAALECSGRGFGQVRYDWYASLGDLRSDWRATLDAAGLTASTGSCVEGQRGEAAWWFGEAREREEGRVACHTDPDGTAVFRWTDDAVLVRISLIGTGGATVTDLREPWRAGDYDPDRLVAALLTGLDGAPALVPARILGTCEWERGVDGGAAVRCRPDEVDEVRYATYDTREALDADWEDLREALALEPGAGGRCFEGVAGEATWNFGDDPDDVDRGRILCADLDVGSMLAWTEWDALVQVALHGARIVDLHAVWADGVLDPVTR